MIDDIKPARRKIEPSTAASETEPAIVKPGSAETTTDDAVATTPPFEDATGSAALANGKKIDTTPSGKGPRFNWFKDHKRPVIVLGVLLLVVGGGLSAMLFRKEPAKKPVAKATPVAKTAPAPTPPPPIFSPLTGMQVLKESAERPVTAIMIENSPDARPQSGLLDAGVVFEAVAEGGITRFLTLFQEGQPGYIGPVRSVRPYYIDWMLPFDAAIAHVGGSKDALDMLKTLNAKDLDQFKNAGAYKRITQRYAPHNVYTNMADLDALSKSKGYTTSKFTAFPRKADTLAKTPTAASIDFNISSALYNVHYDYDPAKGDYKRSEGGKPHIDEKSSVQLAPRVVIAIVVPFRSVKASDGYREQYDTIGSGKAFLFQDGNMQPGTWSKKDQGSQIVFTTDAGTPMEFNRGQTWITAVGEAGDVVIR